jgi:hypothetical protein
MLQLAIIVFTFKFLHLFRHLFVYYTDITVFVVIVIASSSSLVTVVVVVAVLIVDCISLCPNDFGIKWSSINEACYFSLIPPETKQPPLTVIYSSMKRTRQ